ncbi:aminotransferase [Youhaiella tibetensis]|uniref:aspartate transaminase n=2 Tax=Paradevosia tibetensis TaxID=1447062 RepID=A0A5B9DJ94_9HYPH|nr:pyridoxal phosphate-dependent aminotransferase [Youhaiella tibetensis]GGF35100.1 aminotransferase [Youhaiella tibetensis]
MRRVAKRISETPAKSFGMYERAARAEATGSQPIRMEFGRPFADTPEHIKQATIEAIAAGHVHYSHPAGLPELREAAAIKLRERNRLPDVTADDVLVTNGMSHAAFITFMALLDPEDEVILLSPYYPQHLGKIELTGGRPVVVDLDASDGYSIDHGAIAAAITPRTRAILLVNPANPTGRVYTHAELRGLADLAIAHDLVVVSDEIYEDVIFDGLPHISIGALEGMSDRTVSMYAFTKSHAMDGWRVGYLTAPRWLLPALMKVSTNDITHVNTFVQYGAKAAIEGPQEVLEHLLAEDREKRDFTVASLNQMPGVRCASPQAATFAFPDVSSLGIPSQELAERILDQAGVAVEAGSFHGHAGEGHLRISFGSVSMPELENAMQRLARFFNAL